MKEQIYSIVVKYYNSEEFICGDPAPTIFVAKTYALTPNFQKR